MACSVKRCLSVTRNSVAGLTTLFLVGCVTPATTSQSDTYLVPAPQLGSETDLTRFNRVPVKVARIEVMAPTRGTKLLVDGVRLSQHGRKRHVGAHYILADDMHPAVQGVIDHMFEIDQTSDKSVTVDVTVVVWNQLVLSGFCRDITTNSTVIMDVFVTSESGDQEEVTYRADAKHETCVYTDYFPSERIVGDLLERSFQRAMQNAIEDNREADKPREEYDPLKQKLQSG